MNENTSPDLDREPDSEVIIAMHAALSRAYMKDTGDVEMMLAISKTMHPERLIAALTDTVLLIAGAAAEWHPCGPIDVPELLDGFREAIERRVRALG